MLPEMSGLCPDQVGAAWHLRQMGSAQPLQRCFSMLFAAQTPCFRSPWRYCVSTMQDDIPTLRRILQRDRTIAVVGLSAEWHRPSFFAAKYLQDHGYRIVPVNPKYPEILGEKSYARLEDIPFPVDMVDVFRKEVDIPPVAKSAVAIGAKCLWQQLGLKSEEADRIATEAGMDSIWDRCVKIEHARLFGGLNWAGVNTRVISAQRPKQG
jgi:predicted CoA-binding protein